MNYNFFTVEITDKVAQVQMNRPAKLNAMGEDFWLEIPQIFARLDRDPGVRAVVLSGAGEHFCSGIDLMYLASLAGPSWARTRDATRSSCVITSSVCRRPLKQWTAVASLCWRPSRVIALAERLT